MKSIYCSDKRKYNNFYSFLVEKKSFFKEDLKNENKNFMNSLEKLTIKKLLKEPRKNNSRSKTIVAEKPKLSNKYLFRIEGSVDASKKIFSEFSFGLRISYKTINFDKGTIPRNSLLAVSYIVRD